MPWDVAVISSTPSDSHVTLRSEDDRFVIESHAPKDFIPRLQEFRGKANHWHRDSTSSTDDVEEIKR